MEFLTVHRGWESSVVGYLAELCEAQGFIFRWERPTPSTLSLQDYPAQPWVSSSPGCVVSLPFTLYSSGVSYTCMGYLETKCS